MNIRSNRKASIDLTYSDRLVTGAKRMHQARRWIWSLQDSNANGPSNCEAVSANCICTCIHAYVQTHTENIYTYVLCIAEQDWKPNVTLYKTIDAVVVEMALHSLLHRTSITNKQVITWITRFSIYQRFLFCQKWHLHETALSNR